MRHWLLPMALTLLAILSLTTLRSIVPDLVAKQALAFGLGGVAFLGASYLPFTVHQRLAVWLYWLLNAVLLGLLIYGSVTRGINAWLNLPFGFKLQPSQFALPLVALYLSTFFQHSQTFSWSLLGKTLAVIALPCLLILAQPDFGTAVVLAAASMVFLLFNRLRYSQIFNLLGLTIIAGLVLWTVVFQDYQRQRLLGFLDLHQDQPSTGQESSSAYNARQALIAVGSGQLVGRGIGQGVQSHLRFLPERQTDFIFASFVEEWGLLGAVFLLACYFAVLIFLWYMCSLLPHFAQQLYLLSVLAMFLVQILINVGMNLALLPITGITLPFLSYGGSSVIALFYTLGVVQSIVSGQQKAAKAEFF